MITYVVKMGDYLAKIARDHGTTVPAIWNHPDNAQLRALRGSPDVLYPGDILFIPVPEPAKETPPGGDVPPPGGAPPVGTVVPDLPALQVIPYVIRQGDYLTRLAYLYHFDADAVWNDPINLALKMKRDPNLLFPGDILWVPLVLPFDIPLAIQATNHYVASVATTKVHLRFLRGDEPVRHEPYIVRGLPPQGTGTGGVTDNSGMLLVDVPVYVGSFEVLFPVLDLLCPVRVAHMDPVEEGPGIQKRIRQLGHQRVPSRHEVDAWVTQEPSTIERQNILAYQQKRSLSPTGVADEDTMTTLRGEHGS